MKKKIINKSVKNELIKVKLTLKPLLMFHKFITIQLVALEHNDKYKDDNLYLPIQHCHRP